MFSDLKACVKIYTRSVGYWMDASCGEYRPYVCKRRMGEGKTRYALEIYSSIKLTAPPILRACVLLLSTDYVQSL